MRGFAALSCLLECSPKPKIPGLSDPALIRAMDAFIHAPSFSFLTASSGKLRAILKSAQSKGHEILIVGCAPGDVCVDGLHWSARAQIVLEGNKPRMMVALTGVTEPKARIVSARLMHFVGESSHGQF